MACNKIDSGRLKACIDVTGGIKKAWIANFVDVASYTVDGTSNKVTAINMVSSSPAPVFYEYNFNKTTGEMNSALTKDIKNGSAGYTQTLKLRFNKNEQELFDQVQTLVQNECAILVEDMNGQYWVAGELNGMDATEGATAFGVELNDFNGIDVTWTGIEKANFREIEDLAVITAVI